MAATGTPTELTAARRRAVLGVLCLSLMMVVAAVASLNVALPDLARDTGATQSQLQWIVDAYALVFAGLLLPAGALGDRFGRKGILLTGLVVFGGASLAAVFVTDPATLIGLRGVIGVGAALVMPRRCRSSRTSSRPRSAGARSASGPVSPAAGRSSACSSPGRSWSGSRGRPSLPSTSRWRPSRSRPRSRSCRPPAARGAYGSTRSERSCRRSGSPSAARS
jgi:MFS family permease